MTVLRRRRLPEHLEARRLAFERVVPALERGKAALTESVPGTRLPGRPLAETLFEFEEALREVRAGMDAWRAPELEDQWRRASSGLDESLALAERVRTEAPDPGAFEGLIGLIGDLLAPLDAFGAAADRLREVRRSPGRTTSGQGRIRPEGWEAPSVVDALAGESRRVADVVLALPEEVFARPTRCPPWDVKALLGHLYRDVDRILEYRDRPAGPPDTTAVTYWTSYDPRGDAADISTRARQIADGYASGSDLARAFDEHWREAVAAAGEMSPDRSISTSFGPTLRLDEYVQTRVLEMAVHGLDLAHALGREPWTTPEAAEVVREILVGLLDGEPPPELGWDDVTFFDTGTGRRALTEPERAALGSRAGRFPLLA